MAGGWFSDEQIERLASNPYTQQVTPGQIQFTAELKEYLYNELGRERSPREILQNADMILKNPERAALKDWRGEFGLPACLRSHLTDS